MLWLLTPYAWLLAKLPEVFARVNAWALGAVLWWIRGKLIRRNLAAAFPEKDAAWVNRIGRTSCSRTIEMALYSLASPMMSEAEVRQRVTVKPSMLQQMSENVKSGRGNVLFIPHFNLMEMMTAIPLAGADIGHVEWYTLYRPLNQPSLDAWVKRSRERFGVKLVSRKEGFSDLMKALRKGQNAVVLFDQNTSSGVRIQFMGRPCAVTDLPGLIAQRFHATGWMFWTERTGFWRCELKLAPLSATDSARLTLESNAWLENKLRTDEVACANWLWAHDRWKNGQTPDLKDLEVKP
jgi:lauroyl/myristoyl acyltransferase